MKIISYNINGIRAAIKKGLIEWIKQVNPDVICFQEIKAFKDQFNEQLFVDLGFYCFWHSAEKKGYSGVAILCKKKPNKIIYGIGEKKIDCEGRVLKIEYDHLSIYSVYFPSGSSGEMRQDYKMWFLGKFLKYIKNQKKPMLISGDYNICHKSIDIHDPIRNKTVSGFLPEERQWLDDFLKSGFIDSFRYLNPEPHKYSWWSYRANSRNNNKGWRIDYALVSISLKKNIRKSFLLPEAMHSDHCPVGLELTF